MQQNEEIRELSYKLHWGLELAEQRLLEETAARNGSLCVATPDGRIISVSAKELLRDREINTSIRQIVID
ncbi:hypothetical protein FQ707_03330 [Bacteroidaceae bacterium HV4-6-C5C]|jgi:hypothetical protein|nr:hypothetical protein FQ707_03330 [Bacteroidaceae bacterium HV4-6-C5C]